MNDSHRRHLFALLVQIEDTVNRIAQACWLGISPSGGGQRLTPLPPSQWRMLQEALARVVDGYHQALVQLAPEITQRHEEPEPIETTHYWLRLLLGNLQDSVLPELEPERFEQRYGPLEPHEHEALKRLQHTLARELKQVQEIAQMRFLPKR